MARLLQYHACPANQPQDEGWMMEPKKSQTGSCSQEEFTKRSKLRSQLGVSTGDDWLRVCRVVDGAMEAVGAHRTGAEVEEELEAALVEVMEREDERVRAAIDHYREMDNIFNRYSRTFEEENRKNRKNEMRKIEEKLAECNRASMQAVCDKVAQSQKKDLVIKEFFKHLQKGDPRHVERSDTRGGGCGGTEQEEMQNEGRQATSQGRRGREWAWSPRRHGTVITTLQRWGIFGREIRKNNADNKNGGTSQQPTALRAPPGADLINRRGEERGQLRRERVQLRRGKLGGDKACVSV